MASASHSNHASTPPLKFFYRPDALPAAQPTASKHWRLLALKATPYVYIFVAITGTADSMRGRVSASVRRLFVRLSQPRPQQEISIYCCSATLSVYIVAEHRLVLTALSWQIWVIYVFLHLFPRRTFMALVLCPSGHPDNDGRQSTDGNTKH